MAFKKTKIDSMNLVPFIDIMLVLLVIVLMTATFINSGKIPVELPKADGSSSTSKELDEVEITISSDGEYFLDNKPVSLEVLSLKLSEMPAETPILLRGDSKSYFEKFTSLIGVLNSINRTNVEIQVEQQR